MFADRVAEKFLTLRCKDRSWQLIVCGTARIRYSYVISTTFFCKKCAPICISYMTLANPNLHSLVAFHLSQLSLEQIRGRAVFAPECDGKNRLPLFSDVRRNRETNYCWVDAVIIGSSNTITTVIEVEQSGVPRPSQLGGKLLPIAL